MTAPDKPPSLKRQYGSQDKSDPEWSPSEDNRAIAKVETPKKRKVNKFDASGWQKAEARRRQCEVMKVVMTQKTKLWSDVPCLVTRRGAAMDMVDVCHVLANTTNSLVVRSFFVFWSFLACDHPGYLASQVGMGLGHEILHTGRGYYQ